MKRFTGALTSDRTNALALQTVADAVRMARRRLPRPVFDYIDGGAGAEVTMAQNLADFNAVRFAPKFGTTVGVERREIATNVLGQQISMPVLVGPVGFTRSMHPDGDVGGRVAAAAAGTVFVHSSMSGHSITEVANAATGAPYWFQLYFLGGRQGAEQLVARASHANADALVVTLDTPVPGNRERDLQYGAALPIRINRKTMRRMAPYVAGHPRWLYNTARDHFTLNLANAVGLTKDGSPLSEDETLLHWIVEPPTWDDIAWIREQWTKPLIVKGIVTGDDARRAVDLGADAVIASNHGGRQLDQVASSLSALADVRRAVGDECVVMVDGGIRRGSDVVAALCLGADATLLGRAWVYGLAAAGTSGVTRVLDIVKADIIRTMQLLGARTLPELRGHFTTP